MRVPCGLLVFSWLIATCVGGGTWYQGCYSDRSSQVGQDGVTVRSVESPLVDCAKLCRQQRFKYVGIQRGNNCVCLNTTSPLVPANTDSCSRRCSGVDPSLSLWCGGTTSQWSLYLSSGPYLVSLVAEIDAPWVVVDTQVSLDAVVEFASYINFTDDSDEKWLSSYDLVWRIDGEQFIANVTGYGSKITARSVSTFKEAGTFQVEVTASNVISSLTRSFNVTVVLPKPWDLQIVLLNASDHLPSCVPETYHVLHDDSTVVAAFVNVTVALEVSVAVGTNLTFTLRHGKSGADTFQEQTTPADCEALQCKGITKDFVFSETGLYRVSVSVSNNYGILHKHLDVVVMEHKLGDVTFDLEGDTYIRRTHEPVLFLVTLETTARQCTSLRVNFGDGQEKKMSLREHENRTFVNGSFLLEDDSSSSRFALAASYGEGCNLSIVFEYTYVLEGKFTPQIHITNNVGFLKMSLKQDLIIENELLGPKLQIDGIATVNETTKFFLFLFKSSVNLSVVWTIVDKDKTVVDNITTMYSQLAYMFIEPGNYELTVTASNWINSVSTTAQISAQTLISGLSVKCVPSDHTVLHQDVTCTARVDSGSNVGFKWNFKDNTRSPSTMNNRTSIVKHKYNQAGTYNVSVMAWNEVSRLVSAIRQPIYAEKEMMSVHILPSSHEVLVNKTTCFIVHPACNCHARILFDFGHGEKNYEHSEECSRYIDPKIKSNPYMYVVGHLFLTGGVYPVTVFASNNVSSANNSVEITVQEPIGLFEVEVQGHAVEGRTTVFVARQKGHVLARKDLIYTWLFPGGVLRDSLIPVTNQVFPEVGLYHVNLTLRNLVDSVTKQLEVRVHERAPAEVFLQHPLVVETDEEVHFSLVGFARVDAVTAKYSDGTVKRFFNKLSWKHAFSRPGVYELSVSIYGNATPTILQSYIAAQEPIRSLRIEGPSAIKIKNENTLYTWTALGDAGSSLLYSWSVNNVSISKTIGNKYTRYVFRRAGMRQLRVQARNEVSQTEATLNLTVQFPIIYVELYIPRVPLGTQTNVTITIMGGLNFTIACDFGDGAVVNTTSHSHAGLVDMVQSADQDKGIPPIYRLHVSHLYKDIRDYPVTVNASNLFSAVSETSVASVGEPISGVTMTTWSDPHVALDVPVTVSVSVASGEDLTFQWKVTDAESKPMGDFFKGEVHSDGHTSNVTYSFSITNKYRVYVLISNSFYPEPVVETLPFLIHAVDSITSLTLKHVTVTHAAALGKVAEFKAIADGSDVSFHFDFGDGSTQTKDGTDYMFAYLQGTGSHAYSEVGVYTVTVTASNPLGNTTATLKSSFHVQIPPTVLDGTLLPDRTYCCVFGQNVTLVANVIGGTNISYNWKLDDQTELVDIGNTVTHQYRTPGKRIVQVTAYNMAEEVKDFVEVNVVNEIQGVTLKVPKLVLSTSEFVEYRAVPEPNLPGIVDYYNWTFDKHRLSTDPFIKYDFAVSGSQVVSVAASNCAGRAVSRPVELLVVSPLGDYLHIITKGESLVHQPIRFTADLWKGDHLNFTWSFGDGSRPIQRTNTTVFHTYRNIGKYIVNLTAENPISKKTVTLRLFILNYTCKPPEIRIIGDQKNKFTVVQSEDLRIETEVSVNCLRSTSVSYRWSVINASNAEVRPPRGQVWVLGRRNLILPPRALLQGNYTVILTVMLNGTIVYSTAEMDLTVTPAPLRCVVEGGILRTVSQHTSTIHLDGSRSVDPNNLNNSHIRFSWTCELLDNNGPCYNISQIELAQLNSTGVVYNATSSQLILRSPEVAMPMRFLALSHDGSDTDFLFVLEITTSDGRRATSDQVVKIKSENQTMRLKVSCHQCRGSWVNPNEKISLRTECINCPATVSYSWEVFKIYDNIAENEPNYPNNCRPFNAQGQMSLGTGNKSDSIPQIVEQTSKQTSTVPPSSTTEEKTTASKDFNLPFDLIEDQDATPLPLAPVDSGLYPLPLDPQEGLSIGRLRPRVPVPSGGNSIPPVAGEGIAGSRKIDIHTPSSSSSKGRGSDVQERNKILKSESPRPSKQHISSLDHHPVQLTRGQTLTGLDKQSLVIRPDSLLQNRSYIIRVTAHAHGIGVAHAETYFRVNRGPTKGKCSVQPLNGTEMETQFKVYCSSWRDEHQPLTYEVSYTLTSGGPRVLVYRGASHSINFQLPAGDPGNHTVLLSVWIWDKLGARTSFCAILLAVRPKDPHAGTSKFPLQYVNNTSLLPSETEALYRAWFHGNSRTLCNLIGTMATRLNRLPRVTNLVDMQDRQNSRYMFLDYLKELPIRDKVEVIQVAQSLAAATAVSQELDSLSLELGVGLLESIQWRTEVLYTDTADPNEGMLTLAVQAVSSIVGAVADNSGQRSPRGLTTRAITVLDQVLKVELTHHSIGETPIERSAKFVSVIGSHYVPERAATIQINGAAFKLPPNMASITQAARRSRPHEASPSRNSGCFQAHMTSFKKNPFSHHPTNIWKVETEVVALNLYSCDGENITVANLPPNQEVHIQIPRQEKKTPVYSQHILEKQNMNVHQFNLSQSSLDLPLHVAVQLQPVAGRSFPISILIGYQSLPNPQHFYLRRDFPVTENTLKIFLPSGAFNDSGMYYLGIVDSQYNAGRHRDGQVLTRKYTFSLWLGNCLYWDQPRGSWSPHGCRVTDESTADTLQCRCNHLTVFGGHFELIPNDLSFISVESFFNLHQNPVSVILVSLVFCIYVILLALCRQADCHDQTKGGVVYLKDNGGADKQQYEVTVETGFRMGAGSTAKISLILHGEDGMSETRELISEDSRPLFERNSRDKFVMTHPDSLGKLRKVQLWHNNSGPSPSWYLSRVLVKDLITGNVYYFLCEKWFAVEEEDGKVEREILELGGHIAFSTVFWAKGTQYMADFHLWASLLTRPSYSRFTRAQRLTCCVTLLMAYMCLNAMWYKDNIEVRGEFGLLDISWQNLAVGAIICAVIVPLYLILTLLFRRSRVRYPGSEPDEEYGSGKPHEEQSADAHEESVQPIMTYSLLDQSILNWQNIQDWAQKQWLKREQEAVHSTSDVVKQNSQTSAPQSPTLPSSPVLHTLRKEEETDVASSGFEDSQSQAYSQGAGDRNRVQATPTEDLHPQGRPHSPGTRPPTQTKSSPAPVRAQTLAQTHTQAHTQMHAHPHRCHVVYQREQHTLHTSRRIFLPSWCRYLAWFLCGVISVFCAAVTILYGFRFGKTKSTLWLQSLYFSFMFCIFISQPFLILLTVVYTAIRHRRDPCILNHYDDGFYGLNSEAIRRKLREAECCEDCEELGVAARQRSRYLRFARPPHERALLEAKKKVIKEKKTLTLFNDSVVFLLMFLLLAVMAYGKDTASPFYCNQATKDAFVRSGQMAFSDVLTRGDWFQWSRTSLLEAVYGTRDPARPVHPHKQMLIGRLNSYLIGQVQVRQLRVRQESCVVYKNIPITESCRYSYSSGRQDDSLVGVNSSWTQASPYSFNTWGQHGSYDATGSAIQLSRNRSEAYHQLVKLQTSGWLDLQTRAVLVELTLLNVPTNLFSSVTLLLETPPTGAAFPTPLIMSTVLFRYVTHWDNCVLACELMFVVLILIKVRSELCDIVRLKKKYFCNLWNYMELMFGVLSVVYTACFVFRFALVADIVEDLRNTFYEEFVNISFLAVWDEILRALVGTLLFFVIVKFLPLLRYIKVCAKFGNIYKRLRKEIIVFMALFVFILVAFTSLGVLLFGSMSLGLRNAWFGLSAMTAIMVGIHHHPDTDLPDSPWWQIFVLFYLIFGVGLLTSYMVAVMTRRLKVYKQGEITMLGVAAGLKYLGEKFLFWSGIKRVLPIEEPDNVLPPEFTMAEIEYQVDELLFRMNNLTSSCCLPEKPHGYLTDSTETSHGAGDDGISSGGSEDQVEMDTDRLEHRVQRIEDKLYANEPYLAQLIKLDSIGADVLSQEKEKQLRSHLELEVFRQLQIQRQETVPTSQLPGNHTAAMAAALYGATLARSPSSGSTGSRKVPHLELPKSRGLVGSLKQGASLIFPDRGAMDIAGLGSPVSLSLVHPEADSSPESQHFSRPCDTRPKVKVGPPVHPKPVGRQHPAAVHGAKTSKPSSSSENASPQSSESEKVHRRTDSSSGNSGSIERAESLKRPSVKPELPPKPTFIHTTPRDQGQPDSSKASGQKVKPFKLPPERVLQRGELCSSLAAESSSGSEQDAAHTGRRPSGKRSLRKTKSRGKGKGSKGLSPALMLESLGGADLVDLDQVDIIEEVVIHEHKL